MDEHLGKPKRNAGQHSLGPLLAAVCDESITPDQLAVLEKALQTDPQARRFYLEYLDLHASLIRSHRHAASAAELHDSETELLARTEDILSMLGEDAEAAHQDVAKPSQSAGNAAEAQRHRPAPIVIPRNVVYPAVVSFAAVAIFCFVTFCFVSILNMDRGPVSLANIVGENEPIWNSGGTNIPPVSDLRQGQVLNLESGLVEIEFGDGTRVILEGPTRFKILSRDAGDLQLGKLVARVPVKAHGFRIHTPGMRIVDLGTEFGVSLNQQQVAYLHVFEGRVSAAALDAQGKTVRQQVILADEAVYLRPKTSVIEPTSTTVSRYFVRRLPDASQQQIKDLPLPLYSTGVGLTVGDVDPHWQIVAAHNDPNFVPQPAIVTALFFDDTFDAPRPPQWVSLTAKLANLPHGAQYTFRVTLDLGESDTLPNHLRGSFLADDLITAIRANGSSISVPKHAIDSFKEGFTSFVINGSCLKTGQNIIEFDVGNTGSHDGIDQETPMALWVRWEERK